MRAVAELLRRERPARLFFLAHLQSSLGTGAGYVALLLLVYDRLASPWAIALVLLADFLPAMLLGPVFGAAADRWSRRGCAIASDVIRAVAFVGLGLVDGFAATFLLALLAGVGTGLFTPAVLAGLPSLVEPRRLPAATSLYGAIADFGHTAGPAMAAGLLIVLSPETMMVANGVTFALSALVLTRVRFGARSAAPTAGGRLGLLREARDGLRATAGIPGVRTLLAASTATLFFAGMLNVGELLLATQELGVGASGFSVLVAVYGVGVIAGSLAGGRGGSPAALRRRFLAGILTLAAGLVAAGLAPGFGVALAAFAVGGVGNGLVLVHERLLLQTTVVDDVMGRVFGVKDALVSWAFGLSFFTAGALITLFGTRELFVVAGVAMVGVWAGAALALRRAWDTPGYPAQREPLAQPAAGG